jgi:hypothetical protein
MENSDLLNNDLQLSSQTLGYLQESAEWGKFLAIMGFILCGFLAIMAFVLPALLARLPQYSSLSAGFSSGMQAGMTVLYLVCAALLFLPCLYLYKFSIKMQLAVKSVNQESFDESLMNLKSMFKFYGILTIVSLSFYVLIFVISMLTVAMKG